MTRQRNDAGQPLPERDQRHNIWDPRASGREALCLSRCAIGAPEGRAMTLGALPAASSSLETFHATPEPTAPANLVTAIRPAIRADLDHYKRGVTVLLVLDQVLELADVRGLLVYRVRFQL